MTPTWQQLQTQKCFAQLRESSVRDHMPFLMIIFHEDIKSTDKKKIIMLLHMSRCACYLLICAHIGTVFWGYVAANSLVELEAEHSLYTWGVGWGSGPRAFPYLGPCFSIPPPERLCYEPFMALSRRYVFLLMLWTWAGLGWGRLEVWEGQSGRSGGCVVKEYETGPASAPRYSEPNTQYVHFPHCHVG